MTSATGEGRMSSTLAWRVPRVRVGIDGLGGALSFVLGLVIGTFLVLDFALALAPLVLLGAVLLFVEPRARLIFVVFGGLVTFQSSEELTSLKLAYLAGIVVAFGGALLSYSQRQHQLTYAVSLPLLRGSLVLFVMIMLSFAAASVNGVPVSNWLRDVAPYLLFASAPIFALDAQASLGQRALVVLLVAAGTLATLSYAITWVERRELADLPIAQLALPSFFLPAALFSYSISAALHKNQGRIYWLVTAASIFALLLSTGTRTTLVLLVAPLAVAIAARRYLAARLTRLFLLVPAALAISLLLAYSVIRLSDASSEVVGERIAVFQATGDQEADASYRDRIAQSNVAWSVFEEDPLEGGGPGTVFEWRAANGDEKTAFVLDTPVSFPAKFGIVGLAAIGAVILWFATFLRSITSFNHPRTETLALAGYAGVAVVASLLAPPFEDKGFSLGLILILALVLRTSRTPESDGAWPERADGSRGG
jgi:hypothetical protein